MDRQKRKEAKRMKNSCGNTKLRREGEARGGGGGEGGGGQG